MEVISSVKDITKTLEQGLSELFESDRYKEYLTAMSRFHNYSFNNTLLISMQRPDATLVAGFNTWKKHFKRTIKKGERGIKIIAPSPYKKKIEEESFDENGVKHTCVKEIELSSFRAVTVFDISQTEGKEIPSLGIDILTFDVNGYNSFLSVLSNISPVPIEYKDISSDAKGYFSPSEEKIYIQIGLSQAQTIKTLLHEIAHSLLHGNSKNKDNIKNRSAKEVEAESIAYTVCQHFNIDTSEYSFGYIAGWSSGKDLFELKESLEIIRATASQIITQLETQFEIMQKGA